MYEPYLYHFGVKGMKWGVRKAEYESSGEARRKQIRSQYRQANSAARTYFRSGDAPAKVKEQKAKLTQNQINQARYRVARGRSIKRNILSAAGGMSIGALTAAGLVGAAGFVPALAAGAAIGGVGALGAHFSSNAHYYGKQARAYKKLSKGGK